MKRPSPQSIIIRTVVIYTHRPEMVFSLKDAAQMLGWMVTIGKTQIKKLP